MLWLGGCSCFLRFIQSREAYCTRQVGLSCYIGSVMAPGRCCAARVVLVIGDAMRVFLFSIAVLCGLPAVCAADVPVLVPDGTGKSVCHSQSIGLSQGDAPARFCIRNSKFLFAHQEYSVDIREASVLGGIEEEVVQGISAPYEGGAILLKCNPMRQQPEEVSPEVLAAYMKRMPSLSRQQVENIVISLETVEVGQDCMVKEEGGAELMRVKVRKL